MSRNEVHFPREKEHASKGENISAEAVIKRMMKALEVTTQSALASALGVHRAAVSDAKRQNRVPAEWLLRLLRSHGLNPNWLETGLGVAHICDIEGSENGSPEEMGWAKDYVVIPEFGGANRDLRQSSVVSVPGIVVFQRAWLESKGEISFMRLLRVGGESMSPTLADNDLVLVDFSQRDVVAGKIYAVRMDDQIVVKRLEKKPGLIVLESDNRSLYEPIEVDPLRHVNVEIIGKVLWVSRDML